MALGVTETTRMSRRRGRQCMEGNSNANNYRITYQFYILIYQPGTALSHSIFDNSPQFSARRGINSLLRHSFFDLLIQTSRPLPLSPHNSSFFTFNQPFLTNISPNPKHHFPPSRRKTEHYYHHISLLHPTCLLLFLQFISFFRGQRHGENVRQIIGSKGKSHIVFRLLQLRQLRLLSTFILLTLQNLYPHYIIPTKIRISYYPVPADSLPLFLFSSLAGSMTGQRRHRSDFWMSCSHFYMILASKICQAADGGLSVNPCSLFNISEVSQSSTATPSFPFRDEKMKEGSQISSSPTSANIKGQPAHQKRSLTDRTWLPPHNHTGAHQLIRYDFDFINIKVNYFPQDVARTSKQSYWNKDHLLGKGSGLVLELAWKRRNKEMTKMATMRATRGEKIAMNQGLYKETSSL